MFRVRDEVQSDKKRYIGKGRKGGRQYPETLHARRRRQERSEGWFCNFSKEVGCDRRSNTDDGEVSRIAKVYYPTRWRFAWPKEVNGGRGDEPCYGGKKHRGNHKILIA